MVFQKNLFLSLFAPVGLFNSIMIQNVHAAPGDNVFDTYESYTCDGFGLGGTSGFNTITTKTMCQEYANTISWTFSEVNDNTHLKGCGYYVLDNGSYVKWNSNLTSSATGGFDCNTNSLTYWVCYDIQSHAPSLATSFSPMPSVVPSISPSLQPSVLPTNVPSEWPSDVPSDVPSLVPSVEPTDVPSVQPSVQPSDLPSDVPSASVSPSDLPSVSPSDLPSVSPSVSPSLAPTFCRDKPGFFKKKKGCAWLATKKFKKVQRMCKKTKVRELCERTCGLCGNSFTSAPTKKSRKKNKKNKKNKQQ